MINFMSSIYPGYSKAGYGISQSNGLEVSKEEKERKEKMGINDPAEECQTC